MVRMMDFPKMAEPGAAESHAPATQGLVVQVFQMLSDKVEESHKSLRVSLNQFADRMESRLVAHDKEDRLVADRVLVLETNRIRDLIEVEREKSRMKGETDRRMAVVALLVSIAMMIVGHFWK